MSRPFLVLSAVVLSQVLSAATLNMIISSGGGVYAEFNSDSFGSNRLLGGFFLSGECLNTEVHRSIPQLGNVTLTMNEEDWTVFVRVQCDATCTSCAVEGTFPIWKTPLGSSPESFEQISYGDCASDPSTYCQLESDLFVAPLRNQKYLTTSQWAIQDFPGTRLCQGDGLDGFFEIRSLDVTSDAKTATCCLQTDLGSPGIRWVRAVETVQGSTFDAELYLNQSTCEIPGTPDEVNELTLSSPPPCYRGLGMNSFQVFLWREITCGGFSMSSSSVCSSQGTCTLEGCVCDEGYSGTTCDEDEGSAIEPSDDEGWFGLGLSNTTWYIIIGTGSPILVCAFLCCCCLFCCLVRKCLQKRRMPRWESEFL